VSTIVGFCIGLCGGYVFLNHGKLQLLGFIILWIGATVAMHSFPSVVDALSIWASVWQEKSPLAAKLIATPLVGIIIMGAFLSSIWLDWIYGIIIAFYLPMVIISGDSF